MLDIFTPSRKSKNSKQEDPAPVVIDHREKNSLVPSGLAKLGVPFVFESLHSGDYLVNGTLIERKSLSDLKMSIINKRIFSQIKSMKEQKFTSLIIIELGSMDEIYGGIIHENALRGFFLSLVRDESIPILFAKDSEDTAKYICLLRQKKSIEHISLRPSRSIKNKKHLQQYILEGFPGIGPATAKKLMEKFRTLRNIIHAPEEELEKILGKKTKQFMDLLD